MQTTDRVTRSRMWESELELRVSLVETLRTRRPLAATSDIERTVEEFLAFDDPGCDDLPDVWKQRWYADREEQGEEG